MPKETTQNVAEKRDENARNESLRKLLMERRQVVMKEIEDLLGRHRTDQIELRADSVPDSGDMALQDANGEQELSILQMRNQVRENIDLALRRLDEGTYGVCDDCGKEISEARLKVLPFARRCVECQTKAEQLEKLDQQQDEHQI